MSIKTIIGYKITNDPRILYEESAITTELSWLLERYHKLALNGKKSSEQKILDAIEKYPRVPQFKNYLSVLYGQMGDTEKMHETNRWITSEHPDYLFGKLSLASEYYLKKEYWKIPEILGDDMELKSLYPKRETFHENEVISFLKCAVLYFVAIDNLEQAEMRFEIMQKVAPDAVDTDIALKHLFVARMEAGRKRFEEEEKHRISVKTKEQEVKPTTIAPTFANAEIEWLYSNGLYIAEEKLETILSLPRELLISDLEMILQDSINRYAYYNDLIEVEGWDEEKMNFVVHAIFLLGELESTKSIKSIFNVLKQSEEYLDLYFGDFLTSAIWEPIYKIANRNLEASKQFMFEPGVNTFSRTVFTDMVEQIAYHQPERRSEIIQWFKEVILFFLNSDIEDNVIDSQVVGLLICNILHLEAKELKPEIEKLFDKGIVAQGICGVWSEVNKAFEETSRYDKKRKILSIVERYQQITSTWAGYNDDESDFSSDYKNHLESSILPVRVEPKIGRNDPCPCGSGKKYKKCCLNK